MKKFKFENRENNIISGFIEIPKKPIGLCFVMHGLGGTIENSQNVFLRNVIFELNYVVVSFNCVDTFNEHGNNYENATPTKYLHDLEDVISWSVDQDWYQEPFVMVAHSLGGLCVLKYTIDNPDKIKGVAPLASIFDKEHVLKTVPEKVLAQWQASGWAILEPAYDNVVPRLKWVPFVQDLEKYNLVSNLGKIKCPVLLLVGDKDTMTPIESQEFLFDQLKTKKELHIIEDATHRFREKDFDKIKPIIKKWIETLNTH